MKTTRRTFLHTGVAAAAVATAPAVLKAQTGPARQKTIRAVMHGDLRAFDPIWTTANITAYHGAMIYDTLFALDGNLQPKPQMVAKHGVSDDKLTYTFELRDGLKFSDGSPVTADDAVASIRRWAARDGAGQHMMARVRDAAVAGGQPQGMTLASGPNNPFMMKDVSKKDDKTFVIALKEPYGLVIDVMAKTATPLLYVMRKKEAETDPMQQVTEFIGSGPFTFNRDETRQGNRYVYDKNPNYVPRSEPASGMAGGKIAKVDRVIYENMADSQTAMSALQAGEIDFYETPPIDLIEQLEGDRNLKVEVLSKLGNVGWMRLNFLHPPFDKVEARQAMLHLVNQEEYVKATFGNPKYFKKCPSNFACGTPMENDENTAWFKEAPNPAKAKELFAKAGYDGRPVVILHATNIDFMNNAAQITAQRLREIGVNAQLATSDWGGVVTRRANKSAPDQGGWNVFITWAGGAAVGNPIALSGHAANGDKGWFGWPSDETHEKLRDKWALAATLEEQKAVAREIQRNAWNFVPHVFLGQWVAPVAYRNNLRGVLAIPEIVPFWNIEKTG